MEIAEMRDRTAETGQAELEKNEENFEQLIEIVCEQADAVGQLLRRHLVLIEHPAEGLLVHCDLGWRWARLGRIELPLEFALLFRQRLEQLRRYG
jgi:hypothetical protein